jgi:4a-hydroxytetrahydrobiopterin dehydratase
MALDQMKCVPCRRGEPTAPDAEIARLSQQVPQWSISEKENGIKRLERSFKFKDFAEALAFTNKIGEIAEEQGHHPDILTEWGKVTVTWWTHAIKGLHRNDFIMAAKTNELYRGSGSAQASATNAG